MILYGNVYDVTDFLSHHPGGSKAILHLGGTDATAEYDPIHAPGLLEETLDPKTKLGKVDPITVPKRLKVPPEQTHKEDGSFNVQSLLNLDDIEAEATKRLSPQAWSYYYSASDDLISKTYNNTVFRSIFLRPRVFVDCTNCDTSTTVLGYKVDQPFYVSAAAMARLAHPDGEHGIAQACAKYGAMQLISNDASMTPEQIVADAAPGQVFGWQLYVQTDRTKSEAMLARVAKLPAIKFICLTVDAPVGGKREHAERSRNYEISGSAIFMGLALDLTWRTTLPWLVKHTKLPIVIKGIQTHEDAVEACRHPAVKAIIISNHGGRQLDTAPPAVHTLLEIRRYCPEVFDRVEVWADGGIKRGTDVVKALCLGARMVGLGRAPLWGLGVAGKAGVERTLESMVPELHLFVSLQFYTAELMLLLRHSRKGGS